VAKLQLAAPAVVLRAAYAGTEGVPYAKVQVFSPAGGTREYLAGRTDALGNFAFVPNGSGVWRMVVDDEVGHRTEASITVPEPFEAAPGATPAAPSRVERLLTGLALFAGATGVLYGYRARSSTPKS
jgi:nickel transport protein